jgi:hypothetical protein
MLRKTKELSGSKLHARDGEIGHLKDFYFDDQHWTIRYLVADTGNWLPNLKVLLSPFAVTGIHVSPHKAVDLNLTKKQIEESPPIETHMPVSRQFEQRYFQYYGWPYYWPGPLLWGPIEAPGPVLQPIPPVAPQPRLSANDGDVHLRSVEEVAGFYGYQIQALDQAFGRVEQFIFDDQNWSIRYLVAGTHAWLSGKRVLLAPEWIAWISWSEARVYVDFDAETVRRAPEYNPSAEITPEFEQQLAKHYTWPAHGERGELAA